MNKSLEVCAAVFLVIIIGIFWYFRSDLISPEDRALTLSEAMAFEDDCASIGHPNGSFWYNTEKKTWWLGLVTGDEYKKENCTPICVVNEGKAKIDWVCGN